MYILAFFSFYLLPLCYPPHSVFCLHLKPFPSTCLSYILFLFPILHTWPLLPSSFPLTCPPHSLLLPSLTPLLFTLLHLLTSSPYFTYTYLFTLLHLHLCSSPVLYIFLPSPFISCFLSSSSLFVFPLTLYFSFYILPLVRTFYIQFTSC